jgi:multiple sugar transport system permease protein
MINENRRKRFELYGFIVVLSIIALLPYYWSVRAAFLENIAVISLDTPIIPFLSDAFTLEAFPEAWNDYDFKIYFWNSIVYSVGATVISLLIGIPGAYAFARLDFPGRKPLFYTAVFTVTFPFIVITIPVYEIYSVIGLLNTRVGVIIALAIFIQPLVIWLLQGFFRQGVPENIEEAARIDGASRIGAFFRVVLPLSMPAIGATALFSFLSAWNNFLWVFLLTNDANRRTATVALHYIMDSDSIRTWNVLMAGLVMVLLPPIIFYGITQDYLGEGLGG